MTSLIRLVCIIATVFTFGVSTFGFARLINTTTLGGMIICAGISLFSTVVLLFTFQAKSYGRSFTDLFRVLWIIVAILVSVSVIRGFSHFFLQVGLPDEPFIQSVKIFLMILATLVTLSAPIGLSYLHAHYLKQEEMDE